MSDAAKGLTAAEVVRLLDLAPHPEGGYFRETFRDEARVVSAGAAPSETVSANVTRGDRSQTIVAGDSRSASTAIYFLLARGERSRWHRIDAAEIWHYYAGAPLELAMKSANNNSITRVRLGADLAAGERPQAVVPTAVWQSAVTLGDWTLAGCTVAPGFEFAGFEMSDADWPF